MLFLPCITNASVYISEVAWMGSSVSAGHEWIELRNDGAAIDVTDWVISDGMNLNIVLEGTLPANSYAVLERTSEDSAKGTAFMLYTGALVNTGATLRLERADGSLVDQVSGGEGWEKIGGDNVTKETAQYTSKGWVTEAPTPGSAPEVTAQDLSAEDDDNDLPDDDDSESDQETGVELVLPGVTLELEVYAQKTGYVNQPIDFYVEPSGIGDVLIDSLHYDWNFGDSYSAAGKEQEHIFTYPGKYVVTVHAEYKRQHAVQRHEITILPVDVSLGTNRRGDILVNNDSEYEIDLSNYRVRGDKYFDMPPRTILLPRQTMMLKKERLVANDKSMVAIYDGEGVLLDSIIPDSLHKAESIKPPEVAYVAPEPAISAISTSEPFASVIEDQSTKDEVAVSEDDSKTTKVQSKQQLAASVQAETDFNWSYIGLVVVLLLGTLSVYARPKSNEIT